MGQLHISFLIHHAVGHNRLFRFVSHTETEYAERILSQLIVQRSYTQSRLRIGIIFQLVSELELLADQLISKQIYQWSERFFIKLPFLSPIVSID